MRDTGTTESPLYLLLSRRLFSSCVVVGVAQCCHGLQDVHGTRSDRHNTSFYYFCAPQQAAGKLQRIIRFEVEQGRWRFRVKDVSYCSVLHCTISLWNPCPAGHLPPVPMHLILLKHEAVSAGLVSLYVHSTVHYGIRSRVPVAILGLSELEHNSLQSHQQMWTVHTLQKCPNYTLRTSRERTCKRRQRFKCLTK